MIKTIKQYIPLLSVLMFALLACLPLFHKGLHPTHDGEYHVIRFYEFYKVMVDDVTLYPRWAPDLNNGYGIPLFNYVYPLPNYVASGLHVLGVSFIDAFKMNLLLATLFGAYFFYLWVKELFDTPSGIIASIFYSFAPYRFVDIYVRGSVGEVWALAFFPAVLWSITKLIRERNTNHILIAGLFLGLLIFSHNILALMFFCFLLTYIAVLIHAEKTGRKKVLIDTTLVIVFGLSFSAIFWIPALLESSLVRGLKIFDVSRNFADFYQLLVPSWGTGFSGNGIENEMSYQIGAVNFLAIVISLVFFFRYIREKRKHSFVVALLFCWLFLSIIFMLPYSEPLWRNLPLLHYFQFPWRFLSVTIVAVSFLAGFIVASLQSKKRKIFWGVVLALLAISTTISYTKPAYYHDRTDEYYITRSNFIDGTNSPGNSFNTIWFDATLPKTKDTFVIEKGVGKITTNESRPTTQSITVRLDEQSTVIANKAYFPGWQVQTPVTNVPVSPTDDGRISFVLPKGTHQVTLQFHDTISRTVAKMITGITLIILAAFLLHKAQHRYL